VLEFYSCKLHISEYIYQCISIKLDRLIIYYLMITLNSCSDLIIITASFIIRS
jgi:hypothetical protein